MIDLLQATEFIKMPNGNYLNKLSNGKEYSEAELKELLKHKGMTNADFIRTTEAD